MQTMFYRKCRFYGNGHKFMSFKEFPKIYWLLLLVVLFGSVGIFYNYGMLTGGGTDEPSKINSTLKIFKDFDFSDKYSAFFPIVQISAAPFVFLMAFFYLFLGIGGVSQLKELSIIDTYKFVPYFRFITIIFGVIAVYVFYKICLEIFKKESLALIASYFLATSLLFVQQLHIAGSWMLQTAMILVSFYYFLTLLKKENWGVSVFIISAILIVLNVEIELVGLAVMAPLFLIYRRKRKEIKISKEALKLFVFFLAIFLGLALFASISLPTVKDYFSVFMKAKESGFSQTINNLSLYDRVFGFFKILLSFEPLLLILAVFGAITAFLKEKSYFRIFGSYFLLYYVTLGPVLGGLAERRALPLVPVLAFFSANFVGFLLDNHKNLRLNKLFCAGLLIFLINPVSFDYNLLKPGSSREARNWIYKNIPADEIIKDDCWFELNENRAFINEIKDRHPLLLTSQRLYLSENSHLFDFRKSYFAVKESEISDEMESSAFNYLIICRFNEEQKENSLKQFDNAKKIKIYDSSEIFKSDANINLFALADFSSLGNSGLFKLFKAGYYGPHVEIYKLK